MNWKVEFESRALDELNKLDRTVQVRILKFITQRIKNNANPTILGAPLKGKFVGLWKYRIGDYRLICHIEHSVCLILIVSVGHRKNIYK